LEEKTATKIALGIDEWRLLIFDWRSEESGSIHDYFGIITDQSTLINQKESRQDPCPFLLKETVSRIPVTGSALR
jgi:hypothetical protein